MLGNESTQLAYFGQHYYSTQMPPKIPRIPVAAIGPIADVLFSKAAFTGGDLARTIEVDHNSLWMDFNRRGVPLDRAREIAAVMDDWSKQMKVCANALRTLARQHAPGKSPVRN